MRLNTFTDYALRVLIVVAVRREQRSTIADIAATFTISEHHLTKVVHFLGRKGFLRNVRGRGGGLELARPAEEINVGAVVRATEGAALPAECFDADTDRCAITRVCRLRHVLRDAVEAFYGVLDAYTLADLVRNRATLARVLVIEMRPRAAA